MSRGINKVILIGNLGADPEANQTNSGRTAANLSIATTEHWKDKQTGEPQERTEWHRVSMFGKIAEVALEYLRKGSKVYIEGKIRTDKYTDKQGIERWSTDIIANEMQMLGGRDDGNQQQGRPQQQRGNGYKAAQNGVPQPPQNNAFNQDVGFDDDIPF